MRGLCGDHAGCNQQIGRIDQCVSQCPVRNCVSKFDPVGAGVNVEDHGVMFETPGPEFVDSDVFGKPNRGDPEIDDLDVAIRDRGVQRIFEQGRNRVVRCGDAVSVGIADA